MLVLLLVIAGCAPTTSPEEPDPNGELTTLLDAEPGFSDPQFTTTVDGLKIVLMAYDTLLRLDPKTLRPTAGSADLPEVSADGLVYRFRLQPALRYSDGGRVRAKDFTFALGRLCDPARFPYPPMMVTVVGCDEWASLDPAKASPQRQKAARDALFVNGIRVLGDDRFEVVLKEPAAYFPALMTTWYTAPTREEDVERGGDTWWSDPALYVGNGPFVLVERVREERLVFVPNPYARVPPKLKKWTILIGSGPPALAAYRLGEADIFLPGSTMLPAVMSDPALAADLVRSPAACTQYVRFDTSRPPFDDRNLRLALAKAVDRQALVKHLGDNSLPALTFIPPGLPGHDPADNVQSFDPDAARRLLAQSRYAGLAPRIDWPFFAQVSTRRRATTEFLAQQWKEILGLEIVPRAVSRSVLNDLTRNPQTRTPIDAFGWCADYADQQDWLTTLFDSRQNFFPFLRYENEQFDRLVRQADRETDAAKRDDLYLQASRLLSSDAGGIWLVTFTDTRLVKPWVRGLNRNSVDAGGIVYPGEVYVTKAKAQSLRS